MKNENKQYTLTQVIQSIRGDIEPIGECYHDSQAYDNLQAYSVVIKELIDELCEIAYKKDSPMGSVSSTGEEATKILEYIQGQIQDCLEN